jgi:hypothetical protein
MGDPGSCTPNATWGQRGAVRRNPQRIKVESGGTGPRAARAGIHHGGKVSRKIIRGPAGNQRKSKWQFRRHLRLPNRFPRGPLLPINRHIFFPGVAYKNDFPSFSTFNLNVTA